MISTTTWNTTWTTTWTTTRPLKDERDPASEDDAARQNEPAHAIARKRRTALSRQQSREHDAAARCDQSCYRRGELPEWIKHDVGEDERVG